jgi:hypothetical protein
VSNPENSPCVTGRTIAVIEQQPGDPSANIPHSNQTNKSFVHGSAK